MKQGDMHIRALFNDKDIIINDNFWEWFYWNSDEVTSHCESEWFTKSIFFIGDKAYKATIWKNGSMIDVKALQDAGTIFYPEVDYIIETFMAFNNIEDNDLVTEYTLDATKHNEVKGINFRFFHTNINY